MEESGGSRWALVIRDDGEASVVPLPDVPVIQQEGAGGADKNPTVIVLQTQERSDAGSCCSVTPAVAENIAGDGGGSDRSRTSTENITDFISLSGNQVEGSVDHLGGTVITIADTSQPLSNIGSDALENIEISVLEHEETTHTKHTDELNRGIPKDLESKEPAVCSSAETQSTHSCNNGNSAKVVTVKDNKRRRDENRKSVEDPGYKTVENKEHVGEQKREEFSTSVSRWTKKLAYSDAVVEPFEKMEATLHKDLISELGLASENSIFITLHQQGIARGVRVMETSPDQIVVSGSLVELLASRDMILLEIQKIRGLPTPQASVPAGTREVGVMCELIPSPPTARYASSLGLDRSARRYHSVLSRPLSPEPRPQRRRSRKHLLSHSKMRNSDKHNVLRSYSERIYSKQSHHQTSRNVECCIKIEKDSEDKLSRKNCLNSQEQNPNVEILFGDLKTEPECDETIIVSSISDHEVRNIDRDSDIDSKSVMVNKVDDSFTLSSITKDIVLKPLDDRGVQFRGCEGVEGSSNKENIDIDDTAYVNKAQEKEEDEEEDGIDMDVDNDKMICEPEISMSEGHEEDLSKDHSNEQVKFKFSCKICSYKSMRENHFVKHMQLHDKGLALYRCNECNFVSIRASHLRRHKMSHAQQVLNCHLCAYTCDDQKLLTKHMRAKHQTSKQPKPIGSVFECDECEYKTSWHYAYQRHRRTHSPSKMVVMHTCPQCPYKTMRREHFLRHIKNVHQNCRPFLCDICGKAFKRQDALKQHYVSHYQNLADGSSGQVGPYGFECHICQKICRSATYLKEHMATHSEERSFLCEVCGASFKTRSVQRNHVQTIHRRPRAFTCAACEKKFNTKFALRRHMKQHDANIDDVEELPNVTRSPRITGNSRICDLQHSTGPMSHSNSSIIHTSNRNRSAIPATPLNSPAQPTPSAYQITIDGQPAFLLPHIDAQHASIEDTESSIIEGNNTLLVGRDGTSGAELGPLTSQSGGTAVSVPVGSTTVHIVNQDPLSSGSGDLILSADQYEGSRGSTVVASDTANYVNSEHGNSTLLYLTANFQ